MTELPPFHKARIFYMQGLLARYPREAKRVIDKRGINLVNLLNEGFTDGLTSALTIKQTNECTRRKCGQKGQNTDTKSRCGQKENKMRTHGEGVGKRTKR